MSDSPKRPGKGIKPPSLQARPKPKKPSLKARADEIVMEMREQAQIPTPNQPLAIALIANMAVQSCKSLQALYSNESTRRIVELIASISPEFATSFDTRLPSALRKDRRRAESSGDQMRRALQEIWDQSKNLRATGHTEFDHLRLSMEAFAHAVWNPDRCDPRSVKKCDAEVDEENKPQWDGMDILIEFSGLIPVLESTRHILTSASGKRDAALWAKHYVYWYFERWPWPHKDTRGKDLIPSAKSQRRLNPIHKVAMARLNSRNKSNPDEMSPENALRAVVRERLSDAFQEG